MNKILVFVGLTLLTSFAHAHLYFVHMTTSVDPDTGYPIVENTELVKELINKKNLIVDLKFTDAGRVQAKVDNQRPYQGEITILMDPEYKQLFDELINRDSNYYILSDYSTIFGVYDYIFDEKLDEVSKIKDFSPYTWIEDLENFYDDAFTTRWGRKLGKKAFEYQQEIKEICEEEDPQQMFLWNLCNGFKD